MTFASFSFSEKPFSTDVARSYSISCNAGSYTFTGQAATFLLERKVIGNVGSYSISGNNASFTYNQVLQGNAGSYTFTGADASLNYNQRLNCEAGFYTLTGNDCTFIYNQTIYAGAFSFIWSGQEASLRQTHILNAEAGSYSLTGQVANLLQDRVIDGNAYNYIYTGKNADLVYTPIPVVVIESKGGIGKKEKKKREAEKTSREELEAIVKREFDILDGTYQPEVVEVAKQVVLPKIQEIDYTQYQIALAQVNALLLQAKIRADRKSVV